jgi:anti-sigma regulatory factor (Ser/Thr protein kinase)
MTSSPPTIRLEFGSAFDMVDFVQVVSDYVGRLTGLDEDQLYEVSVAVREGVVNAIKHGNKNDLAKRVVVEF